MTNSKTLLKLDGYLFCDEIDADIIQDDFFNWLTEKGYSYAGLVDIEEDNDYEERDE